MFVFFSPSDFHFVHPCVCPENLLPRTIKFREAETQGCRSRSVFLDRGFQKVWLLIWFMKTLSNLVQTFSDQLIHWNSFRLPEGLIRLTRTSQHSCNLFWNTFRLVETVIRPIRTPLVLGETYSDSSRLLSGSLRRCWNSFKTHSDSVNAVVELLRLFDFLCKLKRLR